MANERAKSQPLLIDVETLYQRFEEFVDRASEGQEFLITKDEEAVAKLVPLQSPPRE